MGFGRERRRRLVAVEEAVWLTNDLYFTDFGALPTVALPAPLG